MWDPTVKWFFDGDDVKSGKGAGAEASTPSSGDGGADKGKPGTGMNKKRAREYHVKGRSRAFAPTAEAAAAAAALELRRFKLVKKLRHQLALKCGSLKVTPPLLAFERWLARAMLEGGNAVPTPMLPTRDSGGGLGKDLHRAGVADFAEADAAAAELSSAAAAHVAKLAAPAAADVAAGEGPTKVTVEDAGPLLALKVNGAKPYMQVGGGGRSCTIKSITTQ